MVLCRETVVSVWFALMMLVLVVLNSFHVLHLGVIVPGSPRRRMVERRRVCW